MSEDLYSINVDFLENLKVKDKNIGFLNLRVKKEREEKKNGRYVIYI